MDIQEIKVIYNDGTDEQIYIVAKLWKKCDFWFITKI